LVRIGSVVTWNFIMASEATKLFVHGGLEDFRAQYPQRAPSQIVEVRREVAALRLVNAHLLREVARLKQREAQVQWLVERDALTGLYNRRRLLEQTQAAIKEAVRLQQRVGLLFIDLDGFKAINDEYGHAVGDKILIAVGARIAGRVRTGDIVCRYGGDEFVVLLPRLADAEDAIKVAETIRDRLAGQYFIDERVLRMSAAIGVAVSPDNGENAQELLQRADEFMYREKSRGRISSAQQPSRRREDLP
jgi:diguanylate cyclase (GGDEF)-like protein